ncbi:hypothetical protein GCM10009557_07820 [Virgisporangium ochraceum]|uniref:Thioesterase domain-containing protein n=1 Tax=Virgisporangium ochraceum TaxID=65505 RepID=A0A8J4EHZ5_9ACTN|nr:thioesterase domain-containing protein [Virgisporangium ochraceum]GIJ72702.1 hypothetical protein Voc01_076190 [Virgisporangium ochraceum]
MERDYWRTVHSGQSGTTIAAVDFVGTHARATFSHMAAALPGSHTMMRTAVPKEVADRRTGDPGPYLAAWMRELAEIDDVVAVIGYCAGGPFAIEMSRRLAASGRPAPAVVLIDPEPVSAETLRYQFRLVARAMGQETATGAPDVAGTGPVADGGPGHLLALAADLSGRYEAMVRDSFVRLDLAPDLGDELVLHFRRYLDYLCAAGALYGSAPAPDAHAFISADHPFPDGLDGPCRRFDVAREDFLGDPGVVDAVARLVAADRPGTAVTRGAGR